MKKMDVKAKKRGHKHSYILVLKRNKNGHWFIQLRHSNGNIFNDRTGYSSHTKAVKSAKGLIKNPPTEIIYE